MSSLFHSWALVSHSGKPVCPCKGCTMYCPTYFGTVKIIFQSSSPRRQPLRVCRHRDFQAGCMPRQHPSATPPDSTTAAGGRKDLRFPLFLWPTKVFPKFALVRFVTLVYDNEGNLVINLDKINIC